MQVQRQATEPLRAAAQRLRTVATHRSAIPAALALLAYALAFLQRPGLTYTDSRPELTTDPGLFLHRVTSVWSPTADLGHLQGGQFSGYLLPMGPWFAGADWLGVPLWIAERLWIGTLLFAAGWGAVKLMDALYDRRRGLAHLAAGVLYAANPYVVVYVNRSSVTLLAYCALPWLLLAAHRGLRAPTRWRWPIAIGVLVALGGGGVNTGVVGPVALAPAALVAYEVAMRWRPARAAWSLTWRTAVCVLVASLWWIVPVLLQGLYAPQFLSFTEQPSSIWATTSMSESLRLLGYWITYFGSGFGRAEPTAGMSATYLFNQAVVVASFAVPLVAFGGLRLTRRWRYAPFFVLLAVLTLLLMTAGFPQGKPLEHTLTAAYYDLKSLQFLRTPYKVAPLLALSIACLGGASAAALVARARAAPFFTAGDRGPAPRIVAAAALVALVAVPILWALPLFDGKAVDRQAAYGHIPGAWTRAMADADRSLGGNHRTMVLPGQLFGYYAWGKTNEPFAPTLSRRPVIQRQIIRYADPRSSQLQAVVDDTIQQQRLVPGQLPPLLRLLGIGQIVVGTDGRPEQTGEVSPADLAGVLDHQPGLARPAASYGKATRFAPGIARSGNKRTLPEVRRYAGPPAAPGIVRVHPRAGATVLDGDADGIVESAAYPDGIDPARAVLYAGDLSDAELGREAASGARIVLTDSNRRRTISASRITENRAPTVGPDDPLERELASYDLFGHGSVDQTVALYGGLRYLRSPRDAEFAIFPENRPFAALDGNLNRPWIAAAQKTSRRWIELGLAQPRAIGSIQVHPHADGLGATSAIGVSVNGGGERIVPVHRGWNEIPIGSPRVERLRLRVASITNALFTGRGGIDEIRVPGVRVDERLRLPVRLASRARRIDLSHNRIDVLMQRTTADVPYRAGSFVADAQAENPVDMVDAEPGLRRRIELPAARTFRLEGWASFSPGAPDRELDALTGIPPGWRFASSSRYEGVPGRRASSAFDGSRTTAWIGEWSRDAHAWVAVRAPHEFAAHRVRLRRDTADGYLFPTRVRVTTDVGTTGVLPVSRRGIVVLPRPARTRSLRVDIVRAVGPSGAPGARLLRGVAVAEVEVPGLQSPAPTRQGAFATRCGSLNFTAGGATVRARVAGSIAQLDDGAPLRFTLCGGSRELRLAAGATDFDAPPGRLLRADHVRLSSAPPAPRAASVPPATARVVDPGRQKDAETTGVRLAVTGPSWLVLAQSYSSGWRAWCRDASGHEHSLGSSKAIDGYANGWAVDRGCVRARFSFVPQRTANAAYWFTGLAFLALLAGAGTWWLRRRRAGPAPADGEDDPTMLAAEPADPLRQLGWPAAVGLAIALGAVGGYVFALRAGAALFVATLLLARVGITVRRLLELAALGLAAIPVLYVIRPAPDLGGFFFSYAYHYETAHWIAVASVCALAAAALIDAAAHRRRA